MHSESHSGRGGVWNAMAWCSLAVMTGTFCVINFSAVGRAAELEPWADKRLRVTDGLVIWLDGAVQESARKSRQFAEIVDGAPIDAWCDGSGNRLDLTQHQLHARPKFRSFDQVGFFDFDGAAAHFSLGQLERSLQEATIFAVAAPFSNAGNFRGLVAMNRRGADDFVSGLNIDLGPFPTAQFDILNVEGAGSSGAINLLKSPAGPFRRLVRLGVTSSAGKRGTKLLIDGRPTGERDRNRSTIDMDQLVLGGRCYGGAGRQIRGFFDGVIAELLIYDRVLRKEELTLVDRYLADKYGQRRSVPSRASQPGEKPLVRLDNPPSVQMLMPGFAVRELPVNLPNVNNVLYRPDGKLVALGYNGNIYFLIDSDGDGLEDEVKLFWENNGRLRSPIGMDLTPPRYLKGSGVVVPSKGKCSLILDTDGDDVADEEVIVAAGWQELPHGVDALGAAFDARDGSIYFGLGCQNYTNPYLIDSDGKSAYRLDSERGTIMRIAPDLKSREIVATGIRFPVSIRLNGAGDLFCSDQEGATWIPNGNPFDELLHVEQGRHYGFPPRHPRHLPQVIDEPSTFNYWPQHQSTCGLNFNKPIDGGRSFGPAWWQGDALVVGYSRGKLYRTKLVKTAAGYVAANQLLASANMLLADVCVSPQGQLILAAHSGGPDWGSGPTGNGKLFKIDYQNQDAPLPVAVWAQSPREVRIAFDRELDPARLKKIRDKIAIEAGQFVGAGDRFESLWPGYAVVEAQLSAPRFEVAVGDAQVTPDRRTLILATAPQNAALNYAVTLSGLGERRQGDGELPQLAEIDLHYDLSGIEAVWQTPEGQPVWQGWLPSADLQVARALTRASALHDSLWHQANAPGTFLMRTQIRLSNMLRPTAQPGSQLDEKLPPEKVTLVLRSNWPITANLNDQSYTGLSDGKRGWICRIDAPMEAHDNLHPLEIRLTNRTEYCLPKLSIGFFTNEDSRERPLQISRFLLPWASRVQRPHKFVDNRRLPELDGANWLRGREIFFGNQAGCAKCHTIRGEGGSVGPDLTNLVQRDYASVYRDITQPSLAINPDYITQSVATTDGLVYVGAVRTGGEQLVIGTTEGKEIAVKRADIDFMTPLAISAMPEGIPNTLGPKKMRDLMAFLLLAPPRMSDYGGLPPPPARLPHEVEAVLAGAPDDISARPLKVTLVAGPKDHGPGEHDYPAWQMMWKQLMELDQNVSVTTADEWPSKEDFNSADVLVFYQHGNWTPQRARDIDGFLARGGGLAMIHFAVDGGSDAPGFAKRIGLAWRGGHSKFRHGKLNVDFRPGYDHPIARNLEKVRWQDESYWNLVGDASRVKVLGIGREENFDCPLFWTIEPGKGRVFVSIPGHYSWTFDDPIFRTILLRGIAWSAAEPVDRFNDLVTPGARIAYPSQTTKAE